MKNKDRKIVQYAVADFYRDQVQNLITEFDDGYMMILAGVYIIYAPMK